MGILYGLAPLVVHEGAHYLAALLMGSRLRFRFSWGRLGKIPVPRWIWAWPYRLVTFLHFLLYPHYAGNASDFKGMI